MKYLTLLKLEIKTFYTINLADAQINDAYAMTPGLEAARAYYI